MEHFLILFVNIVFLHTNPEERSTMKEIWKCITYEHGYKSPNRILANQNRDGRNETRKSLLFSRKVMTNLDSVLKCFVAQLVKNPLSMQETWAWSLGWEDPLEKGKATIPVFWSGEIHGVYSPWGGKESDTTEKLSLHYSADKDLYSQVNDLSSGHIWLWELNCKEGRMPKNWCLWNIVLEKTCKSPLNSKEIKPANLKGDQPWIFTGRIDAEAPVFWSSDANRQLTGKVPDAGKDWAQMERRVSEDEMVGRHY